MIRGTKPPHNPPKPSFFATSRADSPLAAWLSFDTTVSAGCDTMAQKTPATFEQNRSENSTLDAFLDSLTNVTCSKSDKELLSLGTFS